MALIIGENSWVTIQEADGHLTNYIGTQDWFTLPDTAGPGEASKEIYLIMAYNLLNNVPGYSIPANSTDDRVKKAQAEMAFYLVDNYNSFKDNANSAAAGVKGFTLSKWRQEFFSSWEGGFPLPAFIAGYLTAYATNNTTADVQVV